MPASLTDAVTYFRLLTISIGIRSFSGLRNAYRRLIKYFSKLAAALIDPLKKYQPTRFETLLLDAITASKVLKLRLTIDPVLAFPRRKGQFMLEAVSCDRQIGAVLSQQNPEGDF